MRMPNIFRREQKDHMFSDWEKCVEEVKKMKEAGTLIELRTEKGELAVRTKNGLTPSHFKHQPLIYAVLQTPTFRKKILKEGNLAIHFDTKEPRVVFHATPVDIPVEQGLKPTRARTGKVNITTERKGIIRKIRDRYNLYPLQNYGLYFASIAETTKLKAAASTRTADADHALYPCFIYLKKPRMIDYDRDRHFRGRMFGDYDDRNTSSNDGSIRIYSRAAENFDYMVKSEKQVMHVPLNMLGVYSR